MIKATGYNPPLTPILSIDPPPKPRQETIVERTLVRETVRELAGKDGRDGVNAFPDVSLTYAVRYVRSGRDAALRELTGAVLLAGTPAALAQTGMREEYHGAEAIPLRAGTYRCTIAPDVTTFAVVGSRTVISQGNIEDLRDSVIPRKILLPAFVAGAPDFELRMLIEFVEARDNGNR